MRRTLVACALVSMIVAGVIASVPPAGGVAGFGDVESNAFYTRAVQWMVDNEITEGTTAECFAPYVPIDRGQAAVLMWRMEGQAAPAGPHGFADVPAWMSDAVAWMVEQGVTLGTTPTTFSPGQTLTRAELVTFLWRLAGRPAPTSNVHSFTDIVPGAFYYTAVLWAVEQGTTFGTTPTTFSPGDTVTRGQVATFFYRYKGSPPVVVDPTSPGCAVSGSGMNGQWFRLNPGPVPNGDYGIERLDCTSQGQLVQCGYVQFDDEALNVVIGPPGQFTGAQTTATGCLPYLGANFCTGATFVAQGRTVFSGGPMPDVTMVVRPDGNMTLGWDPPFAFHCPWFTTAADAVAANPTAIPDCVGI